jgi:regulator of replication initiation timing
MISEQTLISGIEHKVRKLIEINLSLKQENADLRLLLEKTEQEKTVISSELSSKESELFNNIVANTLEKKFGVEEGKKKIDSLVEEIEKCIAVLSD